MKKLSTALAEYLTDTLEMPGDIVYGDVLISIKGYREAHICNYRSIIEFNDTQIKLQAKNCKLKIVGKHLAIIQYTCEEMRIKGIISEITYY